MKLLFIENRYKTWLWDEIASHLESDGHSIVWLVQNHTFLPKTGSLCSLSPNCRGLEPEDDEENVVSRVAAADRGLRYFGVRSSEHIRAYYRQISRCFRDHAPDVVFGELTQSHELLAQIAATRCGTPFLHPTSARYPQGRFCFLRGDTLYPALGSGDSLSAPESAAILEGVRERRVAPDYMRTPNIGRTRVLLDGLRMMASYLAGERYFTPSPWRKALLAAKRRLALRQWRHLAHPVREKRGLSFLYPLQMQPEANIDVYGARFRDQIQLIAGLAARLPSGARLLVKQNPSPKYEVLGSFVEAVRNRPVDLLPAGTSMQQALAVCDGVVTVSGTIALEAQLSGIPAASFARMPMNDLAGCQHLTDFESASAFFAAVAEGTFALCPVPERFALLRYLQAESHAGIVSDPYFDPGCRDSRNIRALCAAFRSILPRLDELNSPVSLFETDRK